MKVTTKVIVTISEKELTRTEIGLAFDPCAEINCGTFDCKDCPLHESVKDFRKAKEKFLNALHKLPVTED